MKIFHLSFLALSVLASAEEQTFTRSAHWVIRTSNLNNTIEYAKQVLGMRVLRHEENDEPCPITCNGDSPTAWSKTMIGTVTEDEGYALEVTYNYGVEKYPSGSGFQSFYIMVNDLDESIKSSWLLGYPTKRNSKIDGQATSIGPDGYRYILISKNKLINQLKLSKNHNEPFLGVKLNVGNLLKSVDFYTNILGMTKIDTKLSTSVLNKNDIALGYETPENSQDLTMMILNQAPEPPVIEQYEGRHAISIPAEKLKEAYNKIQNNYPELIVHEIMELDEQLGVLFIAIVKDFDGFEICLVSSETFDKAVKAAADFKEPDWEMRAELVKTRKAQDNTRAARKMPGVIGGIPISSYESPKEGIEILEHVTHVVNHIIETVKSGQYSKKEGNFLVTGFWIGFIMVLTGVHQISLLQG